MKMRVLIEAVGSPMWGGLLRYLNEAADFIVGTDIDPMSWGLYAVNLPALVPSYKEKGVFDKLIELCRKNKINCVIPSINEGLVGWAKRKETLIQEGIYVVISPLETIEIFTDKWKTYLALKGKDIPVPETSLKAKYSVIKPRFGRGGGGLKIIHSHKERKQILMEDMVSQQFLEGQEYSCDIFCNEDGSYVCGVIRERLMVESGISMKGRVIKDDEIEAYLKKIASSFKFLGPIDIQCFRTRKGIFFTEINPRIAGGLPLSIAATGNWFKWIKKMIEGGKISPKRVKYGLIMMRYYGDIVIHKDKLLTKHTL